MRKLLLVVALMTGSIATGLAERKHTAPPKGVAVAFFDIERLQSGAGPTAFENFKFFFPRIEEIVKHDFPDVELRILGRGELLHLPDGTRLNVQTIQPELGYVLSAPRKKRRVLAGLRSEADFACAASDFFQRPSVACPK
jgi:hypothetical protein